MEDEDSKYVKGPQVLLLTGLLLVKFVVALENTIIATAVPKITSIFDSFDNVGWYGNAYVLPTTSLQPSFGNVCTYFDMKWVSVGNAVAISFNTLGGANAVSIAQNIFTNTLIKKLPISAPSGGPQGHYDGVYHANCGRWIDVSGQFEDGMEECEGEEADARRCIDFAM